MVPLYKEKFSFIFCMAFFQLFLNCSPKYATKLHLVQIENYENIRIYTKHDTLKFNDKKYKDEVIASYIKIDLEKQTISYANENFLEGNKRNPIDILQLLNKSKPNYYVVTSENTFQIPKSVSKYKRKWNDFATPGRSVTPAINYKITQESVKDKKSKKGQDYFFDFSLTTKANEN
jgi:hypothetical protein